MEITFDQNLDATPRCEFCNEWHHKDEACDWRLICDVCRRRPTLVDARWCGHCKHQHDVAMEDYADYIDTNLVAIEALIMKFRNGILSIEEFRQAITYVL